MNCCWNRHVHPAFGGRMDDKSLNLWRQIDGGRRARKLAARRAKRRTTPARVARPA